MTRALKHHDPLDPRKQSMGKTRDRGGMGVGGSEPIREHQSKDSIVVRNSSEIALTVFLPKSTLEYQPYFKRSSDPS